MRSTVKMFAIAIVPVMLSAACSKKEITPESVVNDVTVEAVLKPGETYNLDLSAYSAKETRSSVTQQPSYAEESVLTSNTCKSTGNYRYKAGNVAVADKAVIQLKRAGKCDKPEEITNITLNVKVEDTRESE